MSAAFAHASLGAIRSSLTGWNPSGIPAATVSRPWCSGHFQLSSQSTIGGYLAPSATLAKAADIMSRLEKRKVGSQIGATRWVFTSAYGNYFRIVNRSVKDGELDTGTVVGAYNDSGH